MPKVVSNCTEACVWGWSIISGCLYFGYLFFMVFPIMMKLLTCVSLILQFSVSRWGQGGDCSHVFRYSQYDGEVYWKRQYSIWLGKLWLVLSRAVMRLCLSGGLSYTRVREFVLKMQSTIGLSKSKYRMHRMRSGGATAVANEGVPNRWFKRLEDGKCKNGYVKRHCKRQTQSYTRNLGL